LAPGFVKDPRFVRAAVALGFDFVEVGTLTRYAQLGNPRPRVFRLPRDMAIVNRLGFNNRGFACGVRALAGQKPLPIRIGVNLGKGRRTPENLLGEELREGVQLFARWADFYVVNLSSPNTPGLRALLDPERLQPIMVDLQNAIARASAFWGRPKPPLLLKLHPDLDADAWAKMRIWLAGAPLDGVEVTHTTTTRQGLASNARVVARAGEGGLSGRPLAPHRERMVTELRRTLPSGSIIVAVGGIDSPEAAVQSLRSGAQAVEIYTALIFLGPALIRAVRRRLRLLDQR
jgi:dihydroorotate dehydrogenase